MMNSRDSVVMNARNNIGIESASGNQLRDRFWWVMLSARRRKQQLGVSLPKSCPVRMCH